MTINERFFKLLNERCITQKEFCEATGIPKQTMSGWKKRNTDPPASLITTIANYFDVSVEYILTGEKVPSASYGTDTVNVYNYMNSKEELSEKQLLRYYNAVSESKKAIILGKAAEMYEKTLDEKKKILE